MFHVGLAAAGPLRVLEIHEKLVHGRFRPGVVLLEGRDQVAPGQLDKGDAPFESGTQLARQVGFDPDGLQAALDKERPNRRQVVVAIIRDGQVVGEAREGEQVELVLAATPFTGTLLNELAGLLEASVDLRLTEPPADGRACRTRRRRRCPGHRQGSSGRSPRPASPTPTRPSPYRVPLA